jgi:hypothetical protein
MELAAQLSREFWCSKIIRNAANQKCGTENTPMVGHVLRKKEERVPKKALKG